MRPSDETELAEILRGANGPLAVRGGSTRSAAASGEVLETGGITGLVLYEPGALTLVARAGTPVADLEMILGGEGQRLAFEVPDMRALLGTAGQSTVGGVIAANASGPRRVQAGAARDFLLGVRFVDGRGSVIKNGGRVMKNVTGYDLARLMAGSRGMLGVLTEVALKVLPAPETQATLVARGLPVQAAVAALARALSSPFEVTGAAHLDAGSAETRIRIEGLAGSVGYRGGALLALLGPGWETVTGDASARMWREVRDVLPFAGVTGAVWRVHLKPSDAPGFLAGLRKGADVPALLDWGGGLIWLLMPGTGDGGAAAVRGAVAPLGGHATLVRAAPGMDDVPALHPEQPAVGALVAGLRRQFDPRGLFAGAA
ncbi:MAG: FAD-binding protein [Paracoccaceae bacterium]|nr:MAG: FAD-binding protein [Paracoccaceae bacterium]